MKSKDTRVMHRMATGLDRIMARFTSTGSAPSRFTGNFGCSYVDMWCSNDGSPVMVYATVSEDTGSQQAPGLRLWVWLRM